MKTKPYAIMLVLSLALLASSCSKGGSPLSSDGTMLPSTSGASLSGTVSVAGSNINIGAVQVGVQGSNNYVTPDSYGNFSIGHLPLGNPVVDVMADDVFTGIPLENVQSGDKITVELNILANGKAHLAKMNKHNDSEGELALEIRPKKWNLDWTENEDEVSARIWGANYNTISESSVEIFGPDGSKKINNADLIFDVGGKFFKAKFSQKDALDLIDSPVPGMGYEIKVMGTYGDDEPFELFDTIVIVGKMPKDSEELAMQINPTKWNVNWANSSGTMMVKLWGDGYDQIDPATVKIIGPEGAEDYADSSNLTDDHLIVKFYKNQALTIIPEPTSGHKHTIFVTDDAASFQFQYTVEIVGKKDKI